jgi:hypothetical protein
MDLMLSTPLQSQNIRNDANAPTNTINPPNKGIGEECDLRTSSGLSTISYLLKNGSKSRKVKKESPDEQTNKNKLLKKLIKFKVKTQF